MTGRQDAERVAAERLAGHLRSKHGTGCDDIQNDYERLVSRHIAVHNSGRFLDQRHEHNDGAGA